MMDDLKRNSYETKLKTMLLAKRYLTYSTKDLQLSIQTTAAELI